jgi:hypothetical protein
MVINVPTFDHVSKMLVSWAFTIAIAQDIIIFTAHNCDKFDKLILMDSMEDAGIDIPVNWRWADILPLFRKLLPNRRPSASKLYTKNTLF